MGILDHFKRIGKRCGKCKAGDTLLFGAYPFGNEKDIRPIAWVVLESKDTELLLISKYCLDTVGYCGLPENGWQDSSTWIWENSCLRRWLNNDFYNAAFSKKDKRRILETIVITDAGLEETLHRNNVFILSAQQAVAYFADREARKAMPTPYAISRGARLGWTEDTKEYASWWLLPHTERTGGTPARMDYPYAVWQMGEMQYHSRNVAHTDFTVRPVIRIKK